MDDAAHNVNVSLEAEFFAYYQQFYLDVVNAISEWCEGEISEGELTKKMEEIREKGFIQESDMMTKYEYLKKHYSVGGILRAWYSRLAR